MKRNKPKRQRHECALKRKQLRDAYSGMWFSVRMREISDTVAFDSFAVLGNIAGLPRGEFADSLAFGMRLRTSESA